MDGLPHLDIELNSNGWQNHIGSSGSSGTECAANLSDGKSIKISDVAFFQK
jgi:hypothetical protein